MKSVFTWNAGKYPELFFVCIKKGEVIRLFLSAPKLTTDAEYN